MIDPYPSCAHPKPATPAAIPCSAADDPLRELAALLRRIGDDTNAALQLAMAASRREIGGVVYRCPELERLAGDLMSSRIGLPGASLGTVLNNRLCELVGVDPRADY